MDLGFIALAQNRLDDAERFMRESLDLCRAERLGDLIPWVVEGVAAVALARGSPSRGSPFARRDDPAAG